MHTDAARENLGEDGEGREPAESCFMYLVYVNQMSDLRSRGEMLCTCGYLRSGNICLFLSVTCRIDLEFSSACCPKEKKKGLCSMSL